MTIKEVAQMAGVSPAAVSRYLNGGPVSEKKAHSIEEAIAATGYKPNAMARTMRTGRGSQIGVIAAKIDSESTAKVLAGITGRLSEREYTVMLGVAGGLTEQEIRYIGLMQERQIAGIILMGTVMTPELHAAMEESTKPIVVTGQNFDNCCCVYHQDYEAVHELTRQMLEHGKRRIGYIGVLEEDAAAGAARHRGAQDAWSEAMSEQRSAGRKSPEDAVGADVGERRTEKKIPEDIAAAGAARYRCVQDVQAKALGEVRNAERKSPEDAMGAGAQDVREDSAAAPPLTTVISDGFDAQDGEEAMSELLRIMPDIDGVICATDLLAIGAMGVLRGAGKKIPEDVAIAGVGDCWADPTTAPPLTSVHLFYRECGQLAADMLLKMIEDGKESGAQHLPSRQLGYEIMERESM